MKRKKVAAMLLVLAVSVVGCGGNQQLRDNEISSQSDGASEELQSEEQQDTEVQETENDAQQTDNKVDSDVQVEITKETKEETTEAEDGTILSQYSYDIPVVTVVGNLQATDAINADIATNKEEILKLAAQDAEDAKEHYEIFSSEGDGEEFANYDEWVSYSIAYQNNKIMTITYNNYSYRGGAHGFSCKTAANYNLQTGEKLTFDTFFQDKDSALADIKKQVIKQCESPYYKQRLFDDYQDFLDDVLVEDYWYFSEEGMKFVVNQFMLGSYGAGSFDFVIPYSELPEIKENFIEPKVYIYPVPYGITTEEDLDGDGTKDKISFQVIAGESDTQENEVMEEINGDYTCKLVVNDTDYSELINAQEEFYRVTPDSHYYLVDLDDTDSYVEIAVTNYGNSSEVGTTFFRYDKGEAVCLGTLHGDFKNNVFEFSGDGKVSVGEVSTLLESGYYVYHYMVKEGTFEEIPQEWYAQVKQTGSEMQYHNILKDVNVYTENTVSSETKILTPEDGKVIFEASDNSEWVQLKTEDGSIYYLHIIKDTFNEIDSAGDTVKAEEVFDNLFLAE